MTFSRIPACSELPINRLFSGTTCWSTRRSSALIWIGFGKIRIAIASSRRSSENKAVGAKRAVSGTPTFFVNGKTYSGTKSYEQFKQLVQGEQKRMWSLTEITDQQMSKGPANAPLILEFFAVLEPKTSKASTGGNRRTR
jgi:hypothetical protein